MKVQRLTLVTAVLVALGLSGYLAYNRLAPRAATPVEASGYENQPTLGRTHL